VQEAAATSNRSDIGARDDIVRLVDAFYDRVRADSLLGPIFDEVARVDWAAHLPKMYAFWDSVLFASAGFKGNPLAVHRALARRTPLTNVEFSRWVTLFHETVDSLFAGPMAEEAKTRAVRVAMVMQHHIASDGMAAARSG
jgi:hemoglobin